MSKKTVLIDLGKLKNLYTGLGQVSLQYGKEIQSTQDSNFDWRFLIPKTFETEFGAPPQSEILSTKRRHFPSLCPTYDVWHAIHQDSPYAPGKKHKTKYILTIHDLNFLKEKSDSKAKRKLAALQKKVDRADYLTFISEFSKQEAQSKLNLGNRPLRVIYNGVNKGVQPSETRPKFLPQGDFIFSVGTILKKKNFHVLVNFIKKSPILKLVIVGHNKGPYAEELMAIILKANLENRVFLPGTVDDKTKAYLYQNCKAFCFPSLYEGFGMPVIEAMHYGKPIFLSNKTSLPEIGKDHAFYWDNFEPEYMANTFQKGLISFNRDRETSIEEQQAYASQYTWERNVKAYIEVYREVLAI
jgi:glycosyltransferase involved in cell wall biosynthesis